MPVNIPPHAIDPHEDDLNHEIFGHGFVFQAKQNHQINPILGLIKSMSSDHLETCNAINIGSETNVIEFETGRDVLHPFWHELPTYKLHNINDTINHFTLTGGHYAQPVTHAWYLYKIKESAGFTRKDASIYLAELGEEHQTVQAYFSLVHDHFADVSLVQSLRIFCKELRLVPLRNITLLNVLLRGLANAFEVCGGVFDGDIENCVEMYSAMIMLNESLHSRCPMGRRRQTEEQFVDICACFVATDDAAKIYKSILAVDFQATDGIDHPTSKEYLRGPRERSPPKTKDDSHGSGHVTGKGVMPSDVSDRINDCVNEECPNELRIDFDLDIDLSNGKYHANEQVLSDNRSKGLVALHHQRLNGLFVALHPQRFNGLLDEGLGLISNYGHMISVGLASPATLDLKTMKEKWNLMRKLGEIHNQIEDSEVYIEEHIDDKFIAWNHEHKMLKLGISKQMEDIQSRIDKIETAKQQLMSLHKEHKKISVVSLSCIYEAPSSNASTSELHHNHEQIKTKRELSKVHNQPQLTLLSVRDLSVHMMSFNTHKPRQAIDIMNTMSKQEETDAKDLNGFNAIYDKEAVHEGFEEPKAVHVQRIKELSLLNITSLKLKLDLMDLLNQSKKKNKKHWRSDCNYKVFLQRFIHSISRIFFDAQAILSIADREQIDAEQYHILNRIPLTRTIVGLSDVLSSGSSKALCLDLDDLRSYASNIEKFRLLCIQNGINQYEFIEQLAMRLIRCGVVKTKHPVKSVSAIFLAIIASCIGEQLFVEDMARLIDLLVVFML
eukprot:161185_1